MNQKIHSLNKGGVGLSNQPRIGVLLILHLVLALIPSTNATTINTESTNSIFPPTAAKTTKGSVNYTTNAKLLVTAVDFLGGSVFSPAQLQAVVAPFLGRALDSGDIEEVRYQLTHLYVDNGYINSGAIFDGYDNQTHHLRMRLQEGQLGLIQVKTEGRVQPDYIASRLRIAGATPVHLPTLQARFLTLLDDPVIESVRGAIGPSSKPGVAAVEAEVVGKRPYTLGLILDNHGPLSLGEKRALVSGTLRNITGLGELLTLGFNASDGNKRGRADLDLPITSYDTRLHTFFEHSNAIIKEEDIELLDIKGEFKAYELGITQPLIHTPQRSVTMGLSLGQRGNKTKLLGMPFCFTQGCENGNITDTALRFNQEWNEHSPDQAYTLRSTFSFGLEAFGATRAKTGNVDSKFTTWLLQQQYARQWLNRRLQLFSRLDLQLADSPLPVVEQISVGGAETVRGYRENVLVRDRMLLGSVELRYAFFDGIGQSSYGRLEGAIFTDFARGWSKNAVDDGEDLLSAGLGLLWSWRDALQAQVYWGHPLKNQHHPNDAKWNLQDQGVHLRLQATY